MYWHGMSLQRAGVCLISEGKNPSVLRKHSVLKTHLFHSFKGSFFFINIFSLVFSEPIASLLQLITAAYNTLQSRQKSRYLLKDWKRGSAFESLSGTVPLWCEWQSWKLICGFAYKASLLMQVCHWHTIGGLSGFSEYCLLISFHLVLALENCWQWL